MVRISGQLGHCGTQEVFLGFASASLLHRLSFADVLNEETGVGYQRRFTDKHSLDFRKYIQLPGSTTIPLAFNLRPKEGAAWKIERRRTLATLVIRDKAERVFAQVDCQHRLGYLAGQDISLAFMTFIGLEIEDEMRIFNIINGKAKGLSSSLLDFHDSKLAQDLSQERPELYIALKLNEDAASPWKGLLDLGGYKTSGTRRRASLRTMQKGVKRFIKESGILTTRSSDFGSEVILAFWKAVTIVLEEQWNDPRRYLLTKGIGVYALMSIAADIYREAELEQQEPGVPYFVQQLTGFSDHFDWSSQGPLKGLGGLFGVEEAVSRLRELRTRTRLAAVSNG